MTLSRRLAQLGPRELGWVVFLVILGSAGVSLGYLQWQAMRHRSTDIHLHARELAALGAALLDVDLHETLVDPAQFDSPAYRQALRPLVEFHRQRPAIQYLWTVRLQEPKRKTLVLETSVDPEIRQRQVALGRGQEVAAFLRGDTEKAGEAHGLAELRAGRAWVYPSVYHDDFGSYVEARAPLVDRTGRTIGYLGVDYALDAYERQLDEVRLSGLLAFVLAAVVGGVLARGSAAMRRETIAQREQIALAEQAMRQQRDRANAASEAKSELLRIASHDLKNPLSAIAGLAGLMLKARKAKAAAAPDPDVPALEAIEGSARHMADIVRGILTNEGLESGGLEFRPQRMDLVPVVRDVLMFNRASAERKRITVTSELPDRLEAPVDPKLLREAFDNYVSNAVKYSPPGSAVRVLLRRADGLAEFAVQDSGPGLNAADQAQLFQKFKKLTPRPTGGESSTGLGLSIVRFIAERHGGAVGCETAPGRGARFWLQLPAP